MKRYFIVLLTTGALVCGAQASLAADGDFVKCDSTQAFADCTTAQCDPYTYKCSCNAELQGGTSGVSANPGCIAPTTGSGGEVLKVQSRYSPVSSTGLCSGRTTTWAQCLGVRCTVSGNTATCNCTKTDAARSGGGPYVIVTTDSSYQGQCTDGKIYSSATYDAQVKDISRALGFAQPKVLWSR